MERITLALLLALACPAFADEPTPAPTVDATQARLEELQRQHAELRRRLAELDAQREAVRAQMAAVEGAHQERARDVTPEVADGE